MMKRTYYQTKAVLLSNSLNDLCAFAFLPEAIKAAKEELNELLADQIRQDEPGCVEFIEGFIQLIDKLYEDAK